MKQQIKRLFDIIDLVTDVTDYRPKEVKPIDYTRLVYCIALQLAYYVCPDYADQVKAGEFTNDRESEN